MVRAAACPDVRGLLPEDVRRYFRSAAKREAKSAETTARVAGDLFKV